MKNRYLTLITLVIVALVGLFTVGRVEAMDGLLGPTHTDLQNQYNDQKNQLNAIQSQLGEDSPPWSQDLPAAERFVSVLGGAAVVDRETELVWEMAPDTNTRNWFAAQSFCNNKAVGGHKGWRLPTVQELASLVDPTQSNPALSAGHPFVNVQSSRYWSATTRASLTDAVWSVFLRNGVVDNILSQPSSAFVWCVRGGHGGPDAQ